MNKRILSFAFISAAFFFGCSADGFFSSGQTPPSLNPGGGGGGGNPPGGGGGNASYCRFYEGDSYFCINMQKYGINNEDCRNYLHGEPVSNLNNCELIEF